MASQHAMPTLYDLHTILSFLLRLPRLSPSLPFPPSFLLPFHTPSRPTHTLSTPSHIHIHPCTPLTHFTQHPAVVPTQPGPFSSFLSVFSHFSRLLTFFNLTNSLSFQHSQQLHKHTTNHKSMCILSFFPFPFLPFSFILLVHSADTAKCLLPRSRSGFLTCPSSSLVLNLLCLLPVSWVCVLVCRRGKASSARVPFLRFPATESSRAKDRLLASSPSTLTRTPEWNTLSGPFRLLCLLPPYPRNGALCERPSWPTEASPRASLPPA